MRAETVNAEIAEQARFGVVVIGRNEGERLKRCLKSVVGNARHVVYVDSGSIDGSVALAGTFGAEVVELDTRVPFSPGRARNEGFECLRALHPDVRYVQFIDGDCEVDEGWLETAAAFLDANPSVGAVSGILRERCPGDSIYNSLCASEWNVHPTGEVLFCGGGSMMRAIPFTAVGRFRPELIAGEEPELCSRLRANGWSIWLLDTSMAIHDAAMNRFDQWWRRGIRSGYGSAQRAFLCGIPEDLQGLREFVGIWFWGLLLPVAVLVLAFSWRPLALLLLFLYPLQIARLGLIGNLPPWQRLCNASFLVLAKFPKLLGQLRFLTEHLTRRGARLIEYKT